MKTGASDALGTFIGSMGWAEGGYTGAGGKDDVAGVVHAGEFVVRKSVVDSIGPTGRDFLERLNHRGYADGGFVTPLQGRRP